MAITKYKAPKSMSTADKRRRDRIIARNTREQRARQNVKYHTKLNVLSGKSPKSKSSGITKYTGTPAQRAKAEAFIAKRNARKNR